VNNLLSLIIQSIKLNYPEYVGNEFFLIVKQAFKKSVLSRY
jgi:hypothetical protein